ncbi:pyruvate dehydrogenase (acetyl-transferring), homodimeric type [Bermanella marisrubri]|uniref:Pyruvate dehydrogenase E1 component n=1 Tax=Bermanella marisrubri TaxID=207949 RepID=Q1MZR1_9GAMM|nr:pyruvate dehydrogenase (acetyl-transferring), homodimeric type [Bermanella marisrubri]EAT11496.1 Pyruvate dehydrogenase complex, dehydrogenase (E1) component [Oceanobacter sp. RED65] [Bermanella marisrubri]QIZ85071.1 pyruvate dehydrogenase (acetyl-transferring), homodimeric type [Bermanella marisrubri]
MDSTDHDQDPVETQEWLDAIDSVIREEGIERARFVLERLSERATRNGLPLPYAFVTPYRNTIPVAEEAKMPGDLFVERRIRSLIRWNALAMVVRANQSGDELGGHIASFASSATLYDVGFNYFFRAPNKESRDCPNGDLVYYQGHISPGLYARSFLEGRLNTEQLDNFRREVDGKGLSSYPHPRLMPDYWQFPTVSMGLGPMQAIYQAHFMRYMSARGLVPRLDRKVWAFLGDGECDEPETLGAISLAGREKLENLIFVVNCNLQRLDGPVRGNGKIIQELEGQFRGAGWNVVKVVWGRHWDPLFAKDHKGLMQKRMDEVVDGEFQNYKAKGGAYTKEHFFEKYPELKEMVADMSDEEIYRLNRGGHDPYKVYAAYHSAMNHKGQPTVILAHTIKGYGMGDAAEGKNEAHGVKKLDIDNLKAFRDRFDIPISDKDLEQVPYYRPPEDSPEMQYMRKRRESLGGYMPVRTENKEPLPVPKLDAFKAQLEGTGDREISTTMAFVRMLTSLVKDKAMGDRVVPIVPDEARTFGMEGLFRQLGIYSSEGQLYEPVDFGQMMYYKEDKKGRILEEGINESGAFSAWLAAATSYSTYDKAMVPFYIFYSMFGFQRVGDLSWAAGDCQAQGFLIGATAGRTTLNGEGLQHQDGHSHILANTIPNCITYDPTFAYELAVIMQDGLRRMYQEHERVFYYITVMNENYAHPAMPKGAEEGIIKGLYRFKETADSDLKVQLMGSGTILREVIAAADILQSEYDISADIWSATSINELAREGRQCERHNMLNPDSVARTSFVEQCLKDTQGPVICATDYIKQYSEQIRPYLPSDKSFVTLGTDGFGRSDSREKLREFFEVDRHFVVVAALYGLMKEGKVKADVIAEAMKKFNISSDKLDPLYH